MTRKCQLCGRDVHRVKVYTMASVLAGGPLQPAGYSFLHTGGPEANRQCSQKERSKTMAHKHGDELEVVWFCPECGDVQRVDGSQGFSADRTACGRCGDPLESLEVCADCGVV